MKKIRFGIIGCSNIANISIIPSMLDSKYAELHYIGSRSHSKAKQFAKKFNCSNYGSYEDVLDNKDIDAVYISVPIGLHEKWVTNAAKKKKHVLCEKSSTTSFKSAKKMVLICKKNNVRLMEGLMFRFHPQHDKVKNLIKKDFLGELFNFSSYYGFGSIKKSDIRFNKKLGGGILNDAGCYPICASRMIFEKEPKSIFCNLIIDKKSGVDVKANIFLKYDDSKMAQMSVGYGLFYQSTYRIWGTKGLLYLKRGYNIPPEMNAEIYLNSRKTKIYSLKQVNHFLLMIDNFSRILKNEIKSNFNFENDLLNQARIMDAARKSSKLKKLISINTIK